MNNLEEKKTEFQSPKIKKTDVMQRNFNLMPMITNSN